MRNNLPRPAHAVLLLLAVAISTSAQALAQGPEDEAKVTQKAANMLLNFGKFALSQKVGPKAKAAFEEILRDYDKDHAGARRALGFKKVGGKWEAPKPQKKKKFTRKKGKWEDASNDDKRFKVVDKWRETRLKLAGLHKAQGLATWDASEAAARKHLQRAVMYDPFDQDAHTRLGHVKGGGGYFGSKEQIAFIESLKGIEKHALILAKKTYKVEPMKTIPAELAVLGLEVHGARSEHFTIYTRGSQKNANDCVMWAERALDFAEFCAGEQWSERLSLKQRFRRLGWWGFVWTPRERDKLIAENVAKNPESGFTKAVQRKDAKMAESMFTNITWGDKKGFYEIATKLTPASMHDRIIVHVWEIVFGVATEANDPLLEGCLHASTWYLLSTAMSKRGALPKGTVSEPEIRLPESVNWWMRAMRDQATARTDMPINEVPRIDMSDFKSKGRLKGWSFMTWMLARYPRKWFDFICAVPHEKKPFPSEVDAIAKQVFDRELKDIEEEWRIWASGRGVTAAATGYGPPLLPKAPNAGQLAGLKRLNELRRQAGLPECELDLEATIACVEHAKYLTRYKEHHKWPEAHEQNPAKDGFTPRGMRAGLRSVIVIYARDAADSVDAWFGTVYHRFPLLQENIRRIGFAFEEGKLGAMCVLDMGSLEEPFQQKDGKWVEKNYVPWPPDKSTGWPVGFAYYEHPNPLGDQPAPHNKDDKAGYPVSLQLGHYVMPQVEDATISLFEARKQGKKFVRKGPVAIHVHTPFKALLTRMEEREVVFAIPKAILKKNTWYQANVKLRLKSGSEDVVWHFKTGTKRK